MLKKLSAFFYSFLVLIACSTAQTNKEKTFSDGVKTAVQTIKLPEPYATKSSVNFCKVTGWEDGSKPLAPEGFVVTKYAYDLNSARWIYVLPNGDVLISQANTKTKESPNQITLLRDANKDGIPDLQEMFLSGLNRPFGMLLIENSFYVAAMDGLWKFPYVPGATKINGEGKKILELPAGGYNHHWTRNIIANKNGSKIYVSVGSASNVGEYGMDEEMRRANILEINPDGSGERIYASGLRNPVGMALAPGTNELWTAVNERDKLGDELVPDYITSVKENGFYGWPYSYFGQNVDPRIHKKDARPDLVSKAIVPEVSLGAHTASLGLAFYTKNNFPEKYRNGAFVGQHGSWNRSELSGYKVVYIPFKDGRPAGPPEDFLTGFISDKSKNEVHGRPVGVAVLPDGALLVADDAGNVIWRIAVKK